MTPEDIKKRGDMTGHSVFSPSQLSRILACPASVRESVNAPIEEQSVWAAMGTRKHELVVAGYNKGRDVVIRDLDMSEEDKEHVLTCLDVIEDTKEFYSQFGSFDLKLEQSVDLTMWGLPEVYGTADLTCESHAARLIDITDWKFGSGVPVYATNNEQALAYAAGVISPKTPVDTVCRLRIVQPPLGTDDVWEVTAKYIADWIMDVLVPGLAESQDPNAPYRPGKKQCKFCPAGMTCRARYVQQLDNAKLVFSTFSTLSTVSKKELSDTLKASDEYLQYIKQVRTFAQNELLKGRDFPGWKLVSGRSIRKWADESEAIAWLEAHSSIPEDELYTKKYVSPAQAEKLDRILKKDNRFKELIDKPPGKPQLVTDDDPRPAIDPSLSAESAFSDIAEEYED